MMSMPHSVMKLIQWYNCLQASAVREQPDFASRSTLELEVMCCPLCIPMSLPKLDQPSWPGSRQHQANHINGSHIPLYGALCGPITWWPSGSGA